MDQPVMDVLDGNREKALRYLLTTHKLVTFLAGLKSSKGDTSRAHVTLREVPRLRGSDREES